MVELSPSELIERCEDETLTKVMLAREEPTLAIQWATVKELTAEEDSRKVDDAQDAAREAERTPRMRFEAEQDIEAPKFHHTLADVPWGSHHVQALSTDIDDSVCLSVCPLSNNQPWLSEEVVEQVLAKVKVEDIGRMCENIGIEGNRT